MFEGSTSPPSNLISPSSSSGETEIAITPGEHSWTAPFTFARSDSRPRITGNRKIRLPAGILMTSMSLLPLLDQVLDLLSLLDFPELVLVDYRSAPDAHPDPAL